MVIGNGGQCLRDGMAGTELLCLQRPLHGLVRECLADPIAAMSVNHMNAVGGKLLGRIEYVRKKRLAGQRLQHLRQVRLHALALTCGQDDDGKRGPTGAGCCHVETGEHVFWSDLHATLGGLMLRDNPRSVTRIQKRSHKEKRAPWGALIFAAAWAKRVAARNP